LSKSADFYESKCQSGPIQSKHPLLTSPSSLNKVP